MKYLPQPRKQPKQARSEQMVESILEAAARVLAERGYAAATTNLVAARAGVSVGSLYQYFPNKDSLVAALHERHADQMEAAIEKALDAADPRSLPKQIEAMVRAMVAVHQISPQLHRVLEQEFPFFDAPTEESPADKKILVRIRKLLAGHHDEIPTRNLELTAWTVMTVAGALVHATIIDPPEHFALEEIETMINRVLVGFLTCVPAEVA